MKSKKRFKITLNLLRKEKKFKEESQGTYWDTYARNVQKFHIPDVNLNASISKCFIKRE